MRINGQKVRERPENCGIVIVEYAVLSDLRKRVLDNFMVHGALPVSAQLAAMKTPSFGLVFSSRTSTLEVYARGGILQRSRDA
ncbi:MAG: hypothetical protein LAO21_05165 [Acidobacteriia bacterium]|nr:hypothetical protein [Terriglobia bacterium]